MGYPMVTPGDPGMTLELPQGDPRRPPVDPESPWGNQWSSLWYAWWYWRGLGFGWVGVGLVLVEYKEW